MNPKNALQREQQAVAWFHEQTKNLAYVKDVKTFIDEGTDTMVIVAVLRQVIAFATIQILSDLIGTPLVISTDRKGSLELTFDPKLKF